MERIYLAILVSAFLVLITAAGLLVTKTHILAHHRRTAGLFTNHQGGRRSDG
jgi:hypothetical protein